MTKEVKEVLEFLADYIKEESPAKSFLDDDVIRCGYCGSIKPSIRNEEGWLCCPDCQGV